MTTFLIVQLEDYNRIMINTEDIITVEEHEQGCLISLVNDEYIETITSFDNVLKAMTAYTLKPSNN